MVWIRRKTISSHGFVVVYKIEKEKELTSSPRQSIRNSDLPAYCGRHHCLWYFPAHDFSHRADWHREAPPGTAGTGASSPHCRTLQVLLFFYMVVLFLIFLIQFSVSCAALAIDEPDEKTIIKTVKTIIMAIVKTVKTIIRTRTEVIRRCSRSKSVIAKLQI